MNNRAVKMSDEKSNVRIDKKKRIALYVIYDKDGILDSYRKYYLQELRKVTDVIVSVVCGKLTPESREELEELSDEVFVRENKGLLAGAWIDGIAYLGWDRLEKYDELFMLNDSFFGPFYPLQDMVDAMEKSDADFYGAIKNYEEKGLTEMGGKKFKHGYLRGSIPYFLIIKEHLLHSWEFKNYWGKTAKIEKDYDTFFFAEFDFFDYVVDAGFKVDAYQSDAYKGYMFDNCTHNIHSLVSEDNNPFARIRPFGSDMKWQQIILNYGKDPRQTIEYVAKNTNYDVNMIWEYLLRTKNLTTIYNQMQLEYVVPQDSVEKKFIYSKKIAVILHIYYEDLVEQMANYCENFPENVDFFVTTTDEKTESKIKEEFGKRKFNYICKVRENKGLAISTLWVTYADVVLHGEYEYICYFHDKKSNYEEYTVTGEQFAARCYENLFATQEQTKNIINLFEDNPRLGMLGAPIPYHAKYLAVPAITWYGNYKNTSELAKKLKLNVNIDPNIAPVAPYGDMFWFRADALKKAIEYGFTYDDLAIPKGETDYTILHAIERIYGFAVQDSGYYYATVISNDNARSDLINYKWMLDQICEMMLSKGLCIGDFNQLLWHLGQIGELKPTKRQKIKVRLQKIIPKRIWKVMKKVYIRFGGKKWIG